MCCRTILRDDDRRVEREAPFDEVVEQAGQGDLGTSIRKSTSWVNRGRPRREIASPPMSACRIDRAVERLGERLDGPDRVVLQEIEVK